MDVDLVVVEVEIMDPAKKLTYSRGRDTTIAGLKDELKKSLSTDVPDLENDRILMLHDNERCEDPTLLGSVSRKIL